MINTMTTFEKFTLIGEVFLKIAINFWPVLIIGTLVCIGLARFETRHSRR